MIRKRYGGSYEAAQLRIEIAPCDQLHVFAFLRLFTAVNDKACRNIVRKCFKIGEVLTEIGVKRLTGFHFDR